MFFYIIYILIIFFNNKKIFNYFDDFGKYHNYIFKEIVIIFIFSNNKINV